MMREPIPNLAVFPGNPS
uniref:Uncharacterized protein n=1 Tax=Rhizophora mucronata TaxID=61149 RepID=A0A2P2PQW8_RHIMU